MDNFKLDKIDVENKPSEHITLLSGFKEAVIKFRGNGERIAMTKEYSVFIPSEFLVSAVEDTRKFIKLAREIKDTPHLMCPVSMEERTIVKVKGLEFVFGFNSMTKYDELLSLVISKIDS
ncbi:hypothetical protein vBBceHLY2_00175 [Bacillus phage vB_BceH_LY2]|nr:hypothetical protein vBBceHLY2_00175 [Bacillus phage vB_BceH_LY2]